MSNQNVQRSFPHTIARTIRWLSVPIVLVWLAVAAITNVAVPQLEDVGKEHNVGLASPDAPSLKDIKHIGKVFHEFDSDSAAMIVLEGDKPLGPDAHQFYDTIVKKLSQDTKHVEHIDDFWGDPLTAAGSQSNDGKAAYVQVFLAGNQGEALSLESVDTIRDIVNHTPAPPGVKAYVSGAAPQVADQFEVGSKGTAKVTIVTVAVIAVMLLLVYRSLVTTILVLVTVLVEMAAARGIVSFLANSGFIGLSTYSTNLLTLLVIAAGTDYAIFVVGRYQEERRAGQERESAFYTMFHGTAHVVLGSGLTVAGAVACLTFTRNPYFQSLGIPAALGILVALTAALTLAPAVLTLGSHVGRIPQIMIGLDHKQFGIQPGLRKMALGGRVTDIGRGTARHVGADIVTGLVPGQRKQTDQRDRDRHRENGSGPAHDGGANPSPSKSPRPVLGVE